jgi:hypothetical protein
MCSTFLSVIVTDFKSINTEIITNNQYSDEFTNRPESCNAWQSGHGLVHEYYNTFGHKCFKNWKGISVYKRACIQKIYVHWDITQCRLISRNRLFGEPCGIFITSENILQSAGSFIAEDSNLHHF